MFNINNVVTFISGKKNIITNKITGIKNSNEFIQGKKFVSNTINGTKNITNQVIGHFNVYFYIKGYISNFKTRTSIYINLSIQNNFLYTLQKRMKYSINAVINLSNKIYLQSIKKINLIIGSNISIEVEKLIGIISLEVENIISLSYNEDLIIFETLYNTFSAKGSINSNIEITKFTSLINAFIEIFYDIDGNINLNLIKHISINNNIDFDTLLRLVNEVGININNLIDLTIQDGANFILAKKVNILIDTNFDININLSATQYYILNDYNDQALSTMFNSTMSSLISVTY